MEYLGIRDQTDLYYQKSGEGTELVMLHGWKASSDVYLKVSELLSDRYTCISYDCRGHKRSGVTGAPDLSVLAEDLNEVIGKLCTGKPVLIGWSMGGLTALEYIRKFAPIHSALMRVCGNYAEIRFLAGQHITPRQAVDSVDWGELIDFTLFKTIPLFWIPVNTVGFLLPQEYRIVFAAVLSLAFGILMTVLKLRERKNRSRKESPI